MITLNLGHPSKDDLKTADDLSFDLAADNHLDNYVAEQIDFEERGLRTRVVPQYHHWNPYAL